MIGDRDSSPATSKEICTFHNCSGKANLFASDSTRAIRDTLAIALDAGRLSNRQSLVLELSLAGGNQTRIGRYGRPSPGCRQQPATGSNLTLEARVGWSDSELPSLDFEQAVQAQQRCHNFGLPDSSKIHHQHLATTSKRVISLLSIESIAGPTVIAGYPWFNDWDAIH